MYQSLEQAHPFCYAPPNTQTTAYIGFQLHSMLDKFKPEVPTHSPHGHHAQRTTQPSVEMFCLKKWHHCPVTIVLNSGDQIAAEAPHKHSFRIEAHNCTKCVNIFSKPIAYIGFQLHRMLEEFKFKVT